MYIFAIHSVARIKCLPLNFCIATNGSIAPSSFAGHGMPCPY
jgi:hypothetical protein